MRYCGETAVTGYFLQIDLSIKQMHWSIMTFFSFAGRDNGIALYLTVLTNQTGRTECKIQRKVRREIKKINSHY